jgi:hypothetical protein
MAPASLHENSRAAETIVPQALYRFRRDAHRATRKRRDRAARACVRAARHARTSARCAVVVHHSLSGFAVFFPVL